MQVIPTVVTKRLFATPRVWSAIGGVLWHIDRWGGGYTADARWVFCLLSYCVWFNPNQTDEWVYCTVNQGLSKWDLGTPRVPRKCSRGVFSKIRNSLMSLLFHSLEVCPKKECIKNDHTDQGFQPLCCYLPTYIIQLYNFLTKSYSTITTKIFPGTKSYKIGVCCLLHIYLKFFEMKKFVNHSSKCKTTELFIPVYTLDYITGEVISGHGCKWPHSI